MKISHLFFLSVAAATAVSCSNDSFEEGGTKGTGSTTLMSVTAALRVDQTRAANDYEKNYNYIDQLQGKDDLGKISVFIGSANVNDGNNGVIYQEFPLSQYSLDPATADGQRVFPNAVNENAISVYKAKKQVNVMVSADKTEAGTGLVQWLRDAGYAGGLTDRWFDAPYDLATQANQTYEGTYTAPLATAVSKIAKAELVDGETKDRILMTSEDFVSYDITDGIKANETVANGAEETATAASGAPSSKNRFVREVRRAAARVYLTTTENFAPGAGGSFEIKNGATVLGTVSSLQFVVGQGERRFYVGQKRVEDAGSRPSSYAGSKTLAVRTPGYSYLPATDDQYNATASDSGAIKHYDYATLWQGAVTADRLTAAQLEDGVRVMQRGTAIKGADKGTIEEFLNGTFFLPATHKTGTDAATSGYRKANSTYVLVRGKFTPAKLEDVETNAEVYLTSYTPGSGTPYYTYDASTTPVTANVYTAGDDKGTFYLTSRGKYFQTLEAAIKSFGHEVTSVPAGATSYVEKSGKPDAKTYTIPSGDFIRRFPAGKMLWRLWVNPNKANLDENEHFNAPTVRNNLYAIHINGISGIGQNWNSLVPMPFVDNGSGGNKWNDYTNKFNPDPNPNTDPRVGGNKGVPNVPEDPTCTTCENDPPQPPLNPDEPDNPDNPTDPLPTTKTFMSVESVVLPWQVHGYEVTL